MRHIITILFVFSSILVYSQNTFEVFCAKFPKLSLPIVADNTEWNNLWYFQLDKESTITEEEFQRFIRTDRWNKFITPSDSSYLYHYIPAGRISYDAYIVLFVNCGYVPQPKILGDSDIGAFENIMYVYTQEGDLIDSIVFSGATCITNINGEFANKWDAKMSTWCRFASFSSDGIIVLKTFYDSHFISDYTDSLYVNPNTGYILKVEDLKKL